MGICNCTTKTISENDYDGDQESTIARYPIDMVLDISHSQDSPEKHIASIVPENLGMMQEILIKNLTTVDLDQFKGSKQYNFDPTCIFKWNEVHKDDSFYIIGGPYRYRQDFGILGTLYWGNYKAKKREGVGFKVFPNNSESYFGCFKNDMFNGKGALVRTKFWYRGHFENNLINGKGVYKSLEPDNDYLYIGEFKVEKKSGKGTLYMPDESCYEGEFLNNRKQGQGKHQWSDGSNYVGMFFSDKISGNGCYTYKDGRIYNGEFLENKMHGFGKFIWPEDYYNSNNDIRQTSTPITEQTSLINETKILNDDGKKLMCYEGNYQNNKRNGQGIAKWKSGRTYEGNWKDGKQHGEGKVYYRKDNSEEIDQDKSNYSGVWRDGKRIS